MSGRPSLSTLIDARRADTDCRLSALQSGLGRAEEICNGAACVYTTGSVGRLEASEYSDLDLFIADAGDRKDRKLSNLNEILVSAELIRAARENHFPELALGGDLPLVHTAGELVSNLGTRRDDSSNTLTARCLLLLESRPLLGHGVYQQVIDDVIARYWRDFADHTEEFVPAFLSNDILRMWRTLCVNYEAKRPSDPSQKARARLKHYKLAHSRLLTCYSALLYLQEIYGRTGTVSPDDARQMVKLSPLQRLEDLTNRVPELASLGRSAITMYETFLANSAKPQSELESLFAEKQKNFTEEAHRFGEVIFECIRTLGQQANHKSFYRYLVV